MNANKTNNFPKDIKDKQDRVFDLAQQIKFYDNMISQAKGVTRGRLIDAQRETVKLHKRLLTQLTRRVNRWMRTGK